MENKTPPFLSSEYVDFLMILASLRYEANRDILFAQLHDAESQLKKHPTEKNQLKAVLARKIWTEYLERLEVDNA